MISKYITINAHIYFARKIVVLFLLLLFIPNGLLGKKKPFIGKDRYNRQISEGVENNGDTLSVTYIAFHPFQIDTTKMAVNKIAGRLTKQEIDIFKNFAEVYKFADEGPKEELYVVQGSQIDSIFYDGLFGFKKIVIPSDANKKFSHYYEKGLKEGEWIEWFVDESPREIYNYKKDLLEGPYAIYDSASAQKIIEKMYKKDLLHGVWKEWYLDNTLKLEYSYKNDNLHGVSIDYDSTGKKDSEKMYKEGLKDGEWNFYNDDVVLVRVEVYNDDLKDGLWYTKDLETRDIHYEEYREDKFIVRYTEHYYPNFQLMEKYAYKDSLPHGKWIGYYKDGETKHVKRFEDGKKQGKWQYYTELGDVHTLELFENDKRNGEWYKRLEGKDIQYQFWDMDSLISEYADLHYPNGQLKEKISYKEGLKDGKFTGYYQNGSKKYVKRYEDDIPAGKWQYYTMAGKTNAEEIYVDGKRDDEWYRLEQNGDVYYQFWDMDSLISEYADLHYPNGQLIEKISYKEGLKDGKFTGYYESGETKHKKKYTEDKPDGKWQFFTAGGDKNEEQIYAEGKKVEEWYRIDEKGDTYYQFWDQDSLISEYADLHYSNGQLIEKISYKDGLKDGKFTGYYPSGKVEYIKRYEEDKPMGEWKFVKEDGSTKKIERYEMGKKNEEWITYEENGDVYYQYWVQDSLISEYADLHYPNGQLIEKISYKEGKKNGKFTGYYESGQTKYIRTYKDDKLEGKYADYTESGQILLKQSYVNDLLDGASKEWYLNGKVKVKTSYTAGKLNGGFMSYDSLGRKETKGEYEMGLKTGDWLTWYPSGKKKERLSYFSGKANGMYSLWDEEGRIIKEGEYSNDLKHGVWITFDPDLKRQESYEYYDMGVAKLKYFFKYYDNGNLMEEPSFTEYFRDGEWRQLFDNERLQYLTTYSMGKKYGLYEEWTINKELVQRGYYEYDLMSALWTYAKNDSVIKYEVYDADSIIDGFVYEYYENDQSKADAVFLENGKRDQKWYTYFEEGKDSTISVYDGGKMTGTWYVNYDSTFEVFTETNYENNLKHGDYKEWYIDENPMVEGYYEYGKKHLLWAFWDERGYQRFEEWRMGELYDTFEYEYYDNGQLKEEPSYKNRKKHGKWFRYFPDGEISGVREFANGKRVGEWVDYYRKDEIAFQGIYKDDKKDGPWIWYYMNRGEPGEEGNIMSEVKFSNGELISEKCYKREYNQEINCQEIFGENDYRFAEKK
jgi:antitoxin component YwqK of YwqJK toxin-antitoxin module